MGTHIRFTYNVEGEHGTGNVPQKVHGMCTRSQTCLRENIKHETQSIGGGNENDECVIGDCGGGDGGKPNAQGDEEDDSISTSSTSLSTDSETTSTTTTTTTSDEYDSDETSTSTSTTSVTTTTESSVDDSDESSQESDDDDDDIHESGGMREQIQRLQNGRTNRNRNVSSRRGTGRTKGPSIVLICGTNNNNKRKNKVSKKRQRFECGHETRSKQTSKSGKGDDDGGSGVDDGGGDDENNKQSSHYTQNNGEEAQESRRKRLKKYKAGLSEDELQYFKSTSTQEQDCVMDQERTISKINKSNVPLRFKLLNSKMDDYTKSVALTKLNSVSHMENGSGECLKITNWVTNLCKIPIGEYVSLPINQNSHKSEIRTFLTNTAQEFDKNIYGHKDAKEQIVRILAQWIINPTSKGNVIGIHGSPGVGKTTLVKECICKTLNMPFQFIPLGGASDASYLDGHSFTYEGSVWGKIVDCLMKSKCMNPVIYFDELDKVSNTPRGEEIINILIHLTDPSQNSTYYDKYFGDVPIDLSRCLIILTYNNDSFINPILKDRMIRITANNYTPKDKVQIVKQFMVPEFQNQFMFAPYEVTVPDEVVMYMIERIVPCEPGVRNLKRALEFVFSNVNLARMTESNVHEDSLEALEALQTHYTHYKCIPLNETTRSIIPVTITKSIIDAYVKNGNMNGVVAGDSKLYNESFSHLYM